MRQSFENDVWVNENFEGAYFGDQRLSNRLCVVAQAMAKRPEASIPKQIENWNDTKACYEFLKNPKVSHKRIQAPHKKRVLRNATKKQGVTLFIQDTGEIDYTHLEATKGLGFIGNHQGKGIMFHNCLAITPVKGNPTILGLAHQQVWTRSCPSLVKSETRSERHNRSRESKIWLKNLKAIGSPPENCTWVSVGDRANDIYEFFANSKEIGWEGVVRVSQDRKIEVHGQMTLLMAHVIALKAKGKKTLQVRKAGDSKKREIKLNISWETQVLLQPPQRIKEKVTPVSISVIRCWNEEEDLDWIIYSSIPVTNLEEAIEKIEWYAMRWVIEEFHKCLKTGCRMEASQLESGKAIISLLGILSIIATLLLELRNIAREDGDKLANEVIDPRALDILCGRYKLSQEISVRIFWHSVARLGGFLGRKSDGEPGWQTLWGGWLRLLDMLSGYTCLQGIMNEKFS
jgi:hypothetical protein